MKTYQTSQKDKDALFAAIDGLSDLAYKVAVVRGNLALAGVGTFGTQAEHTFLMKLEDRLDRMRKQLGKKKVYVTVAT